MAVESDLGSRLRTLRRRAGLSQVKLAERLGVSASYLNLIEHNRRRLPAELLFRAADALKVDVRQFTVDGTTTLHAELMEVLDDPELHDVDIKALDVRELAQSQPAVGRAFVEVYRKWKSSQEDVRMLGGVAPDAVGTLDPGRLPSEEVNDLVARHGNHFDEVESVAELFWRRYELSSDRVFDGLLRILREAFRVEVRVASSRAAQGIVRQFDEERRLLTVSEALPPRSRHFHAAHQIGLMSLGPVFDRVLADPGLTTAASRRLGRMVLANYFAGALLMPYERFWEAAETERYDIDLLGHRFRTSFEQVAHRLTTLRRRGMEGVPFHLVKADLAGNVSKRFNGSGITFARVGGGCPLWNVHHAFLQPGRFRVQVQEMPDGTRYFELARTVSRRHGGYHEPETLHAVGLGCRLEHVGKLVYADGLDLDGIEAVKVGTTCRVCERPACPQRAFPNVRHPLQLDERVRRIAFYASVEEG